MKHPFRTAALSAAVIATLGLSSAAAAGRPDLVLAGLKAGKAHEAGELLVKFRDGSTAAQQSAIRQGLGAQKVDTVRAGSVKKGELTLLRLPAGKDMAASVLALSSNPNVEHVSPNWIYQHNATNDTYVASGQLWGMYGDGSSPANQYGSQAAEAWSAGHTSCSGVYVGVIDEGIYYNHTDLAGVVWTNPYDAADGIDNDGNGYVDDTRGWDFDGGTSNINSGGANDDHGTHVTGTIGGV